MQEKERERADRFSRILPALIANQLLIVNHTPARETETLCDEWDARTQRSSRADVHSKSSLAEHFIYIYSIFSPSIHIYKFYIRIDFFALCTESKTASLPTAAKRQRPRESLLFLQSRPALPYREPRSSLEPSENTELSKHVYMYIPARRLRLARISSFGIILT